MSTSRWLLFAHQLPPRPTRLRVGTWRRLQQVGAIQIRPALYVLPDTAACREDFEWLRREVAAMGGQASVFAADPLGEEGGRDIEAAFQRAREEEYRGLTGDIDRLRRTVKRQSRRRPAGAARAVGALRDRWRDLARVDFFHAPGRAQAARALAALERAVPSPRASRSQARRRPARYRGRRWVTRPRPGVDRMASAWLIRRFVDPDATFVFADEAGPAEVAFDMYAGEFSHHGGACTFEVLADRFGLRDAAVTRLAEIVHDLDMNDARFGAVDAPAIGRLVEGLRAAHKDDAVLLEHGIAMFDALARSFDKEFGITTKP